MTTQEFSVTVLPGDGIGREVAPAAVRVLEAVVGRVGGFRCRFQEYPAGAIHYRDSGVALPDATMRAAEAADVILFGAMGWPAVRYADGTEIAPQLDLRVNLGLYAGVRPIKALPGLPRVLADERADKIDFVLIREQTEGLFYARGRGKMVGDEEAYDTMQITRAGCQRVFEFAFRLAQRRKAQGKLGRVTCVDKANVFTSLAFMRKVFLEVAARHAETEAECAYVDAMALNLVRRPWDYDVLVTENMFGDILSDLAAALVGGMGMAPSGDIGDQHALFQPAHGSAPDIAGQGKANPTAMLLSAAMMLEWLGDKHGEQSCLDAGELLHSAIASAFANGKLRPFELGGSSGTSDITRAVLSELASPAGAVPP